MAYINDKAVALLGIIRILGSLPENYIDNDISKLCRNFTKVNRSEEECVDFLKKVSCLVNSSKNPNPLVKKYIQSTLSKH